jgi:hypothetical protein
MPVWIQDKPNEEDPSDILRRYLAEPSETTAIDTIPITRAGETFPLSSYGSELENTMKAMQAGSRQKKLATA